MARGQYLSSHQTGIVKRYYQNVDTISLQKLSEAVSDLYVATEPGKIANLWKSVHLALKKTPADQMRVARLIAERNVESLAKLVNELAAAPKQAAGESGDSRGTGHTPSTSQPAAAAPQPPGQYVTPEPAVMPSAAAVAGQAPSADDLKRALVAFRKKLKVTKLDDESRMSGHRPTTTGQASRIVAVSPPNQFSRAVWDELVKQGLLKYAGSGTYQLVEGKAG